LEVSFPPETLQRSPRDRHELYAAIAESGASSVKLHLERGREHRAVTIAIERARGLDRLARAWPLGVLASAFLFFALAVATGSARPCAAPLCAVSWCLGVALLGELDRVLPEAPGWLGTAEWRARLGVLAWTMLPAALLHLAMRFPVVSPRFRARPVAVLP